MSNINSRILLKADITENWESKKSFVPLKGEICIYLDKTKSINGETIEYCSPRLKIGDGILSLEELEFVGVDYLEYSNNIDSINTEISKKVDKQDGKVLSTNDFTDALLSKLNGVDSGATKTIIDSNLDKNSANPIQNKIIAEKLEEIEENLGNKVSKEQNKVLSTNDFTNKYKQDIESNSTKLSDIDEGAQVNQKAFSNFAIGSATISAESETDTFIITAGTNITLTPNVSDKSLTISSLPLDTSLTNSGSAADAKTTGDRINANAQNIQSNATDISNLTSRVNTILNSDDTSLDQLKEIVTYIKNNKTLIEGITTNKQDKITGAASTITSNNLTAGRVVITNSSGKIAVASEITTTELGYLNGVTSNIQTQFTSINTALSTKLDGNSIIDGGTWS